MPHGLLGLTVAGISAALMGHMSATFNSISTMFTRDLYMRVRPQADPKRQILVGRLAVAAVPCWRPLGPDHRPLRLALGLSPAGLLRIGRPPSPASSSSAWPGKRITTKGVWAGTMTGFVLAIVLMGDRMWTHLYGHAPVLPFMHTKYLGRGCMGPSSSSPSAPW